MVWVDMGSLKNPSQITAVGTTTARRTCDVQSRTKRFKVRQSIGVDLISISRNAKPEIKSTRVDLRGCS